MNKLFSLIKFFIGWPISAISLIFILKLVYSNSKTIIPLLKNFNPSLFLIGLFLFIIYYFLRSLIWKEILKAKGKDIPLSESSYLWAISELKRYTPGNIWSFISRTVLFEKDDLSKKDILSSILIEMELIILASGAVSLLSLSYFFNNYLLILPIYIICFVLIGMFIFSAKINKKINNTFFSKLSFLFSSFSPATNVKLIFTYLFSFIIFALGTYFAAVSIFNLDLWYLSGYIGFFALSLFLGYLSIITPMGLGVREGVITLTLAKFIPGSLAAVIAIFSRIVLIISELLFLSLVFIWKKFSKQLFKFEICINNHKFEIALLFSIVIYIIYISLASFLRYDNFYTGRFDLGNMDQAVWNTIHGRIFEITNPNGTDIISRLAFHADFLLILLSPLYLIWSNPKILLLTQTVVLGLGGIFIYLLGKDILKNKTIALVLAIGFLVNPSVVASNLYDFHPVTLATTFLLATFYFFYKKKYVLFLLFAILSGLAKEEVWLIISFFGFFLIIKNLILNYKTGGKKNYFEILFGISISAISVFIFYYLIWIAIPKTRGSAHFALSYYSDFGSSPFQIIKNIIFTPQKTISVIFQRTRILYLFQLFFPLGFLSLFSPLPLIFAMPDLIINLLSSNNQLHQIHYQYTATITPFIFISAIFAIKYLLKKFPKIPAIFYIYYLIFSIIIAAFLFGPLPGSQKQSLEMFTNQLKNKDVIEDFISTIPPRYSIAATNNLGSHLSRRQAIYTIPVGIDKADIILFLLNDPFAQPSLATQRKMVKEMERDKNYIQIYKNGSFIVFEKRDLYLNKQKPKKDATNLFPFSITALSHREYEPSDIVIEKAVEANKLFKSYLISYLSDGLKIYSLMNIPNKPAPVNGFPVLIINHGYIKPDQYDTVSSYKSITDYFSNNGFLVLKPDYRGNGKSEVQDKALMRFAYPIDVLNLIASVQNIKGADNNQIFLWSHSMGGEVTLETIEITPQIPELASKVKAAVFWAPVSDPIKWFSKQNLSNLPEAKITPFPYTQTFKILGIPDSNSELWQTVSPLLYLNNVNIPVLIQHGTDDNSVPYQWSVELFDDLISISKNARLLLYPSDNHNLSNSWNQASKDSLNFFQTYLNR